MSIISLNIIKKFELKTNEYFLQNYRFHLWRYVFSFKLNYKNKNKGLLNEKISISINKKLHYILYFICKKFSLNIIWK